MKIDQDQAYRVGKAMAEDVGLTWDDGPRGADMAWWEDRARAALHALDEERASFAVPSGITTMLPPGAVVTGIPLPLERGKYAGKCLDVMYYGDGTVRVIHNYGHNVVVIYRPRP